MISSTVSAPRTRIELRANNLPVPPGFNHAYKIITMRPRGRKSYSSLGLTDAANLWVGSCAEAFEAAMRAEGLRSFHVLGRDSKGFPVLRPATEVPFFITPLYRLITSRQDADAPIKLLIDAAIEKALGIADKWVGNPIPFKQFAEKRGRHVEPARLDVILILDPVEDKPQFNRVMADREAAICGILGIEPFPEVS